ncbi:hypothetical protein [Williamsia serinedens]|uniref:Scaffolding protein n=1 Tax=Williamsia serinedens TaxID=391736 RepID=A0ABT1H7G1_9NOCA|nr:hypothetical protein [Williamsia serinedens]MCP2163106.1 hypothetical protein [Williamsia serinedens]
MTAPDPNQPVEDQPVTEPETPTEPETVETSPEDELPEWVKAKLKKVNSEAQSLRQRLKEQEPEVQAAREAERAKLTEIERRDADIKNLSDTLKERDTQLLQARYQIPDDYLEFIGDGTFEEKEARAVKVGQMVQSKAEEAEPNRPPSERPVASMRPGASPTPPPVEDHSYPASWGFMPTADS